MQFFSGKVRLSGNPMNEVPKVGMTAPEVMVLRAIHGADAVVDLKLTDDRRIDTDDERARLAQIYGRVNIGEEDNGSERPVLAVLFGHMSHGLPTRLAGFEKTKAPPKAEDDFEALAS